MKDKLLYILLITALFITFAAGCGGKKEEPAEGENAEQSGEGGEGGEGQPQEAARQNTPAPPPQPAAAPKPPTPQQQAAAKAPAGKDAKGKPFQPKAAPVPDDRFLKIEFDTKEAALVTSFQSYGAKVRRNIFRDIKSSQKLRKDAETAIEQAKKMVEKVKAMPVGTYSETLYKQADENYKQAEAAFKEQNYFKAKAIAAKAYELAFEAIPKVGTDTSNAGKSSIELSYKGFYQLGDEKTAMLTKKDPDNGPEKLYTVKAGDIITEDLSASIMIEGPDGSQIKTNKIEYQIEDITDDDISLANITEKKPAFKIQVSKPDQDKSGGKDKDKKAADKDKDKKAAEPAKSSFQSNSTTTGSPASGGGGSSLNSNSTFK